MVPIRVGGPGEEVTVWREGQVPVGHLAMGRAWAWLTGGRRGGVTPFRLRGTSRIEAKTVLSCARASSGIRVPAHVVQDFHDSR